MESVVKPVNLRLARIYRAEEVGQRARNTQNVVLAGLSACVFLLTIVALILISPLSQCSIEKPFPRCVLVAKAIAR
jgi:hypothetical protein